MDESVGWQRGPDGRPLNLPNAITVVRTIAGVSLAVAAIIQASVWLAVAAYLSYWIGDVLDGLAARLLKQETRFGAVFDIVSDRACASLCVAALLVLKPNAAVPCAIFLFEFLVIDCQLSLAFLRWPLLSPNYFYLVHKGVYRWNWWPPAKVLNTTAIAVLVLVFDSPWYAVALAVPVTVVKVWSLVVVSRLPSPGVDSPGGSADLDAAPVRPGVGA